MGNKKADHDIEAFKGLKTEIGANRVLVPKNELDEQHNATCKMCMNLVDRYIAGKGLFQS